MKNQTYNRYGNGNPVTPHNIHMVEPDGYLTIPKRVCPFDWFGSQEKLTCTAYDCLKQAISDNGGTSVGLFWEVAVTPQKSELNGLWFQNLNCIGGLVVTMSMHDINGEPISAFPLGSSSIDVDLGIDPEKNDTFNKFTFSNDDDLLLVGRGNSAILRITIKQEPENGLLGSDCSDSPSIRFEGGLIYTSFCNRPVIHDDQLGDISSLDITSNFDEWNDSDRKAEIG